MKRNTALLLTAAIVTGLALIFRMQLSPLRPPENDGKRTDDIPPVVDHFACSDYCPGPRERYMVKVYQGIEDEEECRRIGGKPSVYVGWGTFKICLAE